MRHTDASTAALGTRRSLGLAVCVFVSALQAQALYLRRVVDSDKNGDAARRGAGGGPVEDGSEDEYDSKLRSALLSLVLHFVQERASTLSRSPTVHLSPTFPLHYPAPL